MSETREKAAAMHEATDIGTKLTAREIAQLEWLQREPGLWDGVRPERSTDEELNRWLRDDLVRWRQAGGYEITSAGSALLRSLQEKSHG